MKNLRLGAFTLLLVAFLFLPIGIASDVPFANVPFDVTNIPEPVPPPPTVVDFFDLSPFWQQWINIEGLPVLGSANVSPYAVKETAWLLGQMFRHRSDILKALTRRGQTFTMIAHNEVVSDIPELRDDPLLFYWNVRARGGLRKLMGSSEEMVLSSAFVPIHEMAHATLDIMYQQLDPPFDNRLGTVYNAAMEKGLWQGTFFALNKIEYWAEGVGVWFHANNQNPVTTRDALKAYDPSLALLIAEVFGDHDWRYTPIEMRTHLPHLQGYDPQSAPLEVEWPPGVVDAYEELRNPAINERNEWVNLPPYDPSLIPNLHELRNRGRDDDVRTYMLVVSTFDSMVLLYWVYPDGTETLVHRFPPNPRQIDLFPCLVGDILLAKDSAGRNLAVFQAVERTGRVLVAPALNFITPGLSKFSGDNQGGLPGAILANSFVIEVRDENFSMLEGISVTFRVTAGDGTLSITHTTTDENGRAESTLTLGPNLGTNAVSVSAAGIEHPVTFNAVAEAGVHIPNTNLRTAIETALGKAEGDSITPSEMATLTHLDAQNANISDLTGLAFATNLTSLNLGHVYVGGRPINSNSISNISPLAGLTYLTELRLGFNLIADISALAGLTNLTWLDLTGNSVSNIAPVASLTNLTWLDLDGNAISNISPVAGLTNLTFLDIWGTSISDISPVAGLTHLTSLGLGHNNISDISPVAGMTNLTGLYLPSNHITDISSLSGLTNLKTLWLNHNSISNLFSLVANTGFGSGDTVDVRQNRLSNQSLHTHIPALQRRGVTVKFDSRTPRTPEIVSGGNEQGLPSEALASPFVVEIQDQNGVAFEGVPVTFTVTAGGGTLSVTSTKTDANGRAESTLTLGPNPGTNTVTVSVTGIQEGQTFNAEATRVSKILKIVSGDDQEGLPGAALEKPFVVEVRDQSDSPLSGVEVNFSVGSGGGTLNTTRATTNSNGRAESTLTLGPAPGTNTVTVSVTGIQKGQTFNAEGIGIPKTLEIVSGDDQEASPAAALEKPFVVEVRDQTDKPLPDAQVTFSVSSGGGTLSATSVTTDANGRAESTLTLGPNPGINTVTVSVAGIQETRTFNAEGIRTPTTLEIVSGDDQEGQPGAALEKPFVVEVRDQFDNLLPGAEVTFTVSSSGGTLSANSATTDSNGRAESTLTLGPNPGTNTVTASVAGIQETRTFNAEGIRTPTTLEIVSGDDQEGLPGEVLEKPFVVEVRDQFDNLLPGAEVTFTVSSGGGTLSATSVTTDSNGRAESTLTLGPNPGTNTVTVSVTGIEERQTFSAESIRIPKRMEIISGGDQEGLPGAELENPFVVEVRDQFDNLLPGAEVTFSVGSGGGTLSATSVMTDSNGRAESTLTLGPNPGINTVTVSVAGIQETRTFTAESIRIPKRMEIISGKDQEGSPATALEKPFVVEVRDQTDKPLPDAQVTFSVSSGGGTLSATSVTTDSNGRAESTLTLGPNAGTNTVTVSVTGIEEGQTFSAEGIRIPKTLAIVSGSDQQGLPGAALENPFVVEVRDQTDKPLPDAQVTFSVSSGGGTLSANSATTDSNGRAESTLTMGPNPGTNTVTVFVTGIQEQKTFTAEGIRIPLAFWIISGDKQQGLLGEALAKPFVVEVRDRSGEPLPDAQVTFSVTSGGGTLSVTSATTDGTGRAESILTLGPNPGTNTVSVSVTGLQEAQSATAIAEPLPIPQDVNRDDAVNILDLVLVASDLGDEGADLAADVNGDGVVNILDLVLVAGAFGDAAAAPSAQAPQTFTAADVRTWLTDARSLAGEDAMINKGIVVLEQFLIALTPSETALSLNFPNPFNPETWIPYQLGEDANVTLTIYDSTGALVYRLDLGYQLAGYYTDRTKAAYWDGRNESGEPVASGLYFYQLATPSYRQLRRMVILK